MGLLERDRSTVTEAWLMLDHEDLKWIAGTSTELNSILQQIARYADLVRRHKGEHHYVDLLLQRVELASKTAQALFDRVTSTILAKTTAKTAPPRAPSQATFAVVPPPVREFPARAAGAKVPIPNNEETKPALEKNSVRDISNAANQSLSRKKILVVDDEESILELVTDSLSSRGCHVDCAASSENALELASRNIYDVILCDLNLESDGGKIVSGFTLRDRVLEDTARRGIIPPTFIFMTGDLVDAAIGEQGGVENGRFLQKPFRIAELVAMLNELTSTVVLEQKKNAS